MSNHSKANISSNKNEQKNMINAVDDDKFQKKEESKENKL
jgi:hypothetical protein